MSVKIAAIKLELYKANEDVKLILLCQDKDIMLGKMKCQKNES